MELVKGLRSTMHQVITVVTGETFKKIGNHEFLIDPRAVNIITNYSNS